MTTTPPTPRVSHPLVRRCWARVHRLLYHFSRWYCWAFGEPCIPPIIPLPFGLLLKWSDRTSIGEAVATQMVRAAGIPAPRVLCYGEDPAHWMAVSILMTRLPGLDAFNSDAPFVAAEEQPWWGEFAQCVRAMRRWRSPFPAGTICSPAGGPIKSIRVPDHVMGPFASETELHDFLLQPASRHGFATDADFERATVRARKLYGREHRIVFTHGDLSAHNLLLDDENRLAGIIDWESAGWCPEYWDFSTALRFGSGSWWNQAMIMLSDDAYAAEADADRAVGSLTADAFSGW